MKNEKIQNSKYFACRLARQAGRVSGHRSHMRGVRFSRMLHAVPMSDARTLAAPLDENPYSLPAISSFNRSQDTTLVVLFAFRNAWDVKPNSTVDGRKECVRSMTYICTNARARLHLFFRPLELSGSRRSPSQANSPTAGGFSWDLKIKHDPRRVSTSLMCVV